VLVVDGMGATTAYGPFASGLRTEAPAAISRTYASPTKKKTTTAIAVTKKPATPAAAAVSSSGIPTWVYLLGGLGALVAVWYFTRGTGRKGRRRRPLGRRR